MIVIAVTSILALIFVWLGQRSVLKNGMFIGFLILTLLSAIRYKVGTDYENYMSGFERITSVPFSWDYVFSDYFRTEPGWVLLNHFFSFLGGFDGLIAFISIVEGLIYYYIIKRYVSRTNWTFACFIYIFTADYFYVMNMSMLRQGLAVSLCLLAFDRLRKKLYLISAAITVCAILVHTSALLFLPFLILEKFRTINLKICAILLIAVNVFLWGSKALLENTILSVVSLDEFEGYQAHLEGETSHFGLGYLIKTIPFYVSVIVMLFKSSKISGDMIPYVLIPCIGWAIHPFALVSPMVLRFCIYFMAFSVVSIPYIYGLIGNKLLRYSLVFVFIFITSFTYIGFFGESSVYHDGFSSYQTIFNK